MPDDPNQPPPPLSATSAPPRSGYAQMPYAQAAGANYAAPVYAPRTPRPAWFWPLITLGSLAILGFALWATVFSALHSAGDDGTSAFASSRIAVIDVSGVIVDADKLDKQLEKFGDDSSVKAILLHIDSPGGGAAASQEIFHEVMRIRHEKHKKVVASIQSVGASGAYYIASACDSIYANDASVVGSVGVIMEWTNYGDLMKWARLKPVVIHAGALKDAGDPTHDMTPQEAAYFQSLVDNMYGQFIHDVASGRHTSDDRIHTLATGQVWTGQQALPLGLIDKIGGYRDALIDTARSVGIPGEPATVRPHPRRKVWPPCSAAARTPCCQTPPVCSTALPVFISYGSRSD